MVDKPLNLVQLAEELNSELYELQRAVVEEKFPRFHPMFESAMDAVYKRLDETADLIIQMSNNQVIAERFTVEDLLVAGLQEGEHFVVDQGQPVFLGKNPNEMSS